MNDETGYIPKSLDAQERFLWWEMDQAILAILMVGIGVIVNAMMSGILLGIVAAWQYGRFKAGKHPRFAVHAMYWWLPSEFFVKTRAMPASCQRSFLG